MFEKNLSVHNVLPLADSPMTKIKRTASLFSSILILLLVLAFSAFSQKPILKFEHLSTNAGLSQNNVLCVLQDRKGFMWLGTREGLNKYDGYSFTLYKNDPKNENSISNNYISDMLEDSSGIIWIATWGGGLNKFDERKNRFTSFKHDEKNSNSISSNLVTRLTKDSEGFLWIGTEDGGLNRFDPQTDQFKHYTHTENNSSSLSDMSITRILE